MTIFNLFALLGGLGLFIYGMNLMSDGLEAAAGNKMRKWLGIVTRNRFSGLLLGTGMTIAVQSSSATTVMAVSYTHLDVYKRQPALRAGHVQKSVLRARLSWQGMISVQQSLWRAFCVTKPFMRKPAEA